VLVGLCRSKREAGDRQRSAAPTRHAKQPWPCIRRRAGDHHVNGRESRSSGRCAATTTPIQPIATAGSARGTRELALHLAGGSRHGTRSASALAPSTRWTDERLQCGLRELARTLTSASAGDQA